MAKYECMERVYEMRGIEFCSMQVNVPFSCLLPHGCLKLRSSTGNSQSIWYRDSLSWLRALQGPVYLKKDFSCSL